MERNRLRRSGPRPIKRLKRKLPERPTKRRSQSKVSSLLPLNTMMQGPNVPQWMPLKTRNLACVFETDTGYLRPVKIGGVEVLRAIYGAVRDRNWDTVLPVIELERVEQGEDDFCLEFTARCERAPISFWWKGTIHAQGESLEFRFEGQAIAELWVLGDLASLHALLKNNQAV